MTLAELITTLEAADPTQTVRHGFTHPHSYRGDYMDLAFEPATDVTVADMLADARNALGATYEGWKGGDFTMGEHTWCWLSVEGDASGETISALLLELMLAEPAAVPAPATGQAVLRDRIADVLAAVLAECDAIEADYRDQHDEVAVGAHAAVIRIRARVAVLEQQPAVLPAPVDRSAVLEEAAADFEARAASLVAAARQERNSRLDGSEIRYVKAAGWKAAAAELRRKADETPGETKPWLSDSARIGRALIWSWADIGKGAFGEGYRAAQAEARALLGGQRGADADVPADAAQQPKGATS